MGGLINFIIDVLGYGFIDSMILCFMAYTINYRDIKFLDIFKQAIYIDAIICITIIICPTAIYSQILMALFTGLFFMLYNKNYTIIDYAKYCLPIIIMSIFEFFSIYLINNILEAMLLSDAVNSFYRICIYLGAKLIELIIFYMWRRIHMKVVIGGIVRR